jgi:hypothetical protein
MEGRWLAMVWLVWWRRCLVPVGPTYYLEGRWLAMEGRWLSSSCCSPAGTAPLKPGRKGKCSPSR